MSDITPETMTIEIVRDVWARAWSNSLHWTRICQLYLNTGNKQAAVELCDEINRLRAISAAGSEPVKVTAETITDEQIRSLLDEYPPGSTEAYWCNAALETRADSPQRRRGLREHCARVWNGRADWIAARAAARKR